MKNNMIETLLGAVVLLVAGVFVVFAYSNASLRTSIGYEVRARFDRVGDLKQGDDVKLAGIKVGSVTSQKLDPKTYQAVITLTIEPGVKLPADTAAEVALAGLLGGNYILLTPGGSARNIAPGGEITNTHGSINLIDLIGKAMFSSKDGLDKKDGAAKGSDASNPLLAPLPAPGAK